MAKSNKKNSDVVTAIDEVSAVSVKHEPVLKEVVVKPVTDEEVSESTFNVGDAPESESNMGKLFLRHFYINSEKSDKVITKLRSKVYFPKNPNIKPGWYVSSIIEERDNYGVMDTLAITEVPIDLWYKNIIKGVYVNVNHKENCMEIYRSVPADKLQEEESIPIHTIPIPEPNYSAGNSIQEILKAKNIA